MFIKALEMNNFRQFKGKQKIDFACSSEKNITIIMGENGAGKTTLAQAFLWVLYGQTDFKDKKVVNKEAMEKAIINDDIVVRIDLVIEEDGKEYTISRMQKYIKKSTRVEMGQAEIQVTQKIDGKVDFFPQSECQHFIENILPNELSKFFFFDGERIRNMSDEIQKGKSKEFANAVRGLVGLNAVMNSINHIKDSRGASTVIGRYNKKIDESGNKEVKEINNKIAQYQDELEKIEERVIKESPNIEKYTKESIRLNEEILSYAPAEKMRRDYEYESEAIKKQEILKADVVKKYIEFVNSAGLSFFLKPIVKKTIEELKNTNNLDKGIPHIHAKTINYLIERKKCLCGHSIETGSEEFIELTKLLDYLPPKSIGTMISQNNKKSNIYLKQSNTFFDSAENYFKRIRSIDNEIEKSVEKQTNLYNKIIDISNLDGLKFKKLDYEKRARETKANIDNMNKRIGLLQGEIQKLKTKKESFLIIDKSNRKYKLYRDYAVALFNKLNDDYEIAETYVRENLEKKINSIFTDIYDGGLALSLDENYNITIRVEELEYSSEDIERSTAQNYSVIFAFIAGIIEMAKEEAEEDTKSIFDNAVGYPLVMDAPLSAFDKKRIKNICDTIPKIAQQVIFFIKDTDGDVAEIHLGNAVGKKYEVVKESLIVSNVRERV